MKKTLKRLALHCETLRGLDSGALREPAGGVVIVSTHYTCVVACTERPVSACICP